FELTTAGASADPATNPGGSSATGVHDRLTILGTLNAPAGSTVNITATSSGFNQASAYSWRIATTTGGVTGTPALGTVGGDFSLFAANFTVTTDSSNVYLNFVPVPEPATSGFIVALAFGTGALVRRRLSGRRP